MIVNISPKPNTSITADIGPIELTNVTIFAGENNAGKTTLVKAIGDYLKEQNITVLHIPAERVLIDNEIKTGNASDPLRNTLMELVEVSFDTSNITSLIHDIESILPLEFGKYNVDKTELIVKTKNASSSEYEKAIKEVYIKKLIESFYIKDNYIGKADIEVSKVGQGAERLIIASLLKYLVDKQKERNGMSDQKTCIVFEEPEIYLHPKLKQDLYSFLSEIANDHLSNVMVIMTTHDPYFIDLASQFKIYKTFRDSTKNYSTQIIEIKNNRYLNYDSSSEINYLIFGVPTPSYFLELYEGKKISYMLKNNQASLSYKKFDDEIASVLNLEQLEKDDHNEDVTFVTRLRHDLAHPSSVLTIENFKKWGEMSIQKLQELPE